MRFHPRTLFCTFALLGMAFLLIGAAALLAQETRGTIQGKVLDPSGARVPGVEVVVKNVETNTTVVAITNDAGLYEVPLLMPGNYEITAETTGFKKAVRRGITLTVGSRVVADMQLDIGQQSEVVTVTAQEPLLETTTASSAQVFEKRSIADLPVLLNNAMLLSGLAEGMQRGSYNYLGPHSTVGASDYNTGGGVGGNEWVLDGTPNTGNSRRNAYLPSTDAVEEMRVESTSFDASVGHTTGAYVTMQSKAGTNRFHGAASDNHWQQRWNATPNADNANYWSKIKAAEAAGNQALADELRSQPRQGSGRANTYAASIGGPVIIPKLFNGKDKLFFFFIYNGMKDAKPEAIENRLLTVPTADERKGDFSRLLAVNPAKYQIYDPLTTRFDSKTGQYVRNPFVGNIIPASRQVNPMYKYYEKFYPLPNNPPQMTSEGQYNYFNAEIPYNWDYYAFQGRIDWIPNASNRFFGRFSKNKFLEDRNDWTFETARELHRNWLNRIGKGANIDYVHTFNPTTVLNVAVAYTRYVDNNYNLKQITYKPSDVGLPAYMDQKAGDYKILPRVDFSTYPDTSGSYPVLQPVSVGTLKADFMKYLGKHSLKAGWDGRMYYRVIGSAGYSSGYFEFRNNLLRQTSSASGIGTMGLEWAAFMLGIPNSMYVDTNDNGYITTPYQAFFLQDNYKVSSKLTLNLGLRFEWEGSIRERFDRGLRDWDPTIAEPLASVFQSAYAASPLAELPASDFVVKGGGRFLGKNAPRTISDPTFRALPRFGFAYSLNDKTVVRGGYGIFYDTLNVSYQTIDQTGYSRNTATTITNDNGVTWNYGYFSNNNPPTADPFPVRSDGTRWNVPLGSKLGSQSRLGQGFPTFINPYYEPAQQQRWRIEVQRQLAKNYSLSLAYEGTYCGNLGITKNLRPLPKQYWATGLVRNNTVANDMTRNVTNPFTIGNLSSVATSKPDLYQQLSTVGFFTSKTIQKQQLLRPFPQMTGLNQASTPTGEVVYNAMLVRLDKRFSNGFQFNTHYEWNHSLSRDWFPNEYDPLPDWRENSSSRPHRWVVTSIYELPVGDGRWLMNRKGILNALLGGWQLGIIWQAQSGNTIEWGNVFYYGSDTHDIALPAGQRSAERWFNTDNFERSTSKIPANYHSRVFPSRLNWVRTDPVKQLDANVGKTFRITEGLRTQFRMDLLNALNNQVLAGPNTDPTSGSFGKITSLANIPRYIQFQLRVAF